jgi:hypothetical protein
MHGLRTTIRGYTGNENSFQPPKYVEEDRWYQNSSLGRRIPNRQYVRHTSIVTSQLPLHIPHVITIPKQTPGPHTFMEKQKQKNLHIKVYVEYVYPVPKIKTSQANRRAHFSSGDTSSTGEQRKFCWLNAFRHTDLLYNSFPCSYHSTMYCLESRSRGISYMKYVNGRRTGLVTFCVETAFYDRLLKRRYKGG